MNRTAAIVLTALALAGCRYGTVNGEPVAPKPKQQAAFTTDIHVRQDYPLEGLTNVYGHVVISNVSGPTRSIYVRCLGRVPDGSGLIIFAGTVMAASLKPGQSQEKQIYGAATRYGPVSVRCDLDDSET